MTSRQGEHGSEGPLLNGCYRQLFGRIESTKQLSSADALAYPSRTPFEEDTLKLTTLVAAVCLAIPAITASAQQKEIPKNIADSVGGTLRYTEGQFLAIAE